MAQGIGSAWLLGTAGSWVTSEWGPGTLKTPADREASIAQWYCCGVEDTQSHRNSWCESKG